MNRARRRQTGLTLVEVLLAMAIMAMVLAALKQLQDSGSRAALNASLVAEASVLCQSEMDSWLAGSKPSTSRDNIQPITGTDQWSRRITLQPIPTQSAGSGLSLLTVEVFRGRQRQPQFTLSRWVEPHSHGSQP